jgi:hypothetical protein
MTTAETKAFLLSCFFVKDGSNVQYSAQLKSWLEQENEGKSHHCVMGNPAALPCIAHIRKIQFLKSNALF